MQVRLLLFLIGFFVGCLADFDIEKSVVTVNVVGTEVTITVPENPDVKSVFFSTELDDGCTAGYTFLHSVNSSQSLGYKQDLKKKLNVNDMLKVFGVFETKDQVITKTYEFKIDANGNGVKQNIPEPTNPVNCNPFQQIRLTTVNEKPKPDRLGRCIPAEWSPNVKNRVCSGNLIFEENFLDNNLLNWTRASFSRVYSKHVEFATFLKNDVNTRVKDGQLHITATFPNYTTKSFHLPDCTSTLMENRKFKCGKYSKRINLPLPPVNSAALRTQRRIMLKYGRYEIRARMPIGNWLFPYIILQPNENELDADPVQHIRIAYARGNPKLLDTSNSNIGGNMLYGSVFTSLYFSGFLHEEKREMAHYTPGARFGDDFHNYTMIWHKDRIIFKVDGITYGTITNKKVLDKLNTPAFYYLVLGLTAGGTYNFPDHKINLNQPDQFKVTSAQGVSKFSEYILNKSNTWTHPKLVIEHVRVYATDPQEE